MTKTFDRFMLCLTTSSAATLIQLMFGKVDRAFLVLLIAMGIDLITGIMVGFENKELSSKRCFKGLMKKSIILIYVILANQLDLLLNVNYIRIGICYMYIVNDILSIIENGAALGVPVPETIKKALEFINEPDKD